MGRESFKLCSVCGYKNDLKSESCEICHSSSFVDVKLGKNNKKNYFLLLFMVFIITAVFIPGKRNKKINNNEIYLFVSEKKPVNYYTYLKSIEQLGYIKHPDENDEMAVMRAFQYNDKALEDAAAKTLDMWYKNTKNKKYINYKVRLNGDKKIAVFKGMSKI
jgi:hypothetical protein